MKNKSNLENMLISIMNGDSESASSLLNKYITQKTKNIIKESQNQSTSTGCIVKNFGYVEVDKISEKWSSGFELEIKFKCDITTPKTYFRGIDDKELVDGLIEDGMNVGPENISFQATVYGKIYGDFEEFSASAEISTIIHDVYYIEEIMTADGYAKLKTEVLNSLEKEYGSFFNLAYEILSER